MAINVTNICKSFGSFEALSNINFKIETGEIVGLLGPNGAGKSTLMKILSGVIPLSSGEISICGANLNAESLKTKRNIGYLPESNPLYPNMYIKEYLEFSAGFYKLGKDKSNRINEMIEVTGLNDHLKKKIGILSKGLKQRVGLSQALLHDPKVLILDEPTSGLDPNQIIEIRNLILSLGKNKTILFSSHIMQEVEAICERLIILNDGHIVNDSKTKDISKNSVLKNIIDIEFDSEINEEILLSLSFIKGVVKLGHNKWRVEPINRGDIRKDLMAFAVAHNRTILSLNLHSDNLEEVFQKITKKV
jgi:ABC-2 type transport system ATP-binding protein